MHKSAKIAVFVIVIIAMIAVLGPFLIGVYLQKKYDAIVAVYNSFPGVHAQKVDYQRHWFSSDAVITINVNNTHYFDVFRDIGIAEKDVPRYFTFNQHIQHGPFIYHMGADMPSWFGLAAIRNELQPTANVKTLFSMLGVNHDFVQRNSGYISLFGNYFHHVKLSSIKLLYPKDNAYFAINGLETHLWIGLHAISGDLMANAIEIYNQGDYIALPDVKYEFDVYPSKQSLWGGTSSLSVSQFTASETGGLKMILSDFYYHSAANVVQGEFSSTRQLDIGQFEFYGQKLGPIHIQASLNKVNAQALADIFAAYTAISQRGELYPNQLQQKIASLLPSAVNSGSNVKLESLEINSPEGKLQVNGELSWNMNNQSIPDELPDLLKSADARLDLRVSKPFANEVIDFFVGSPFINDMTASIDENAAEAASDEINFNMDNNAQLIESLVMQGQLRDADAMDLLLLQKQMVPIQDYANQINQILWNRYLTLQMSYILYWGYLNVEQSIEKLEKMITKSQDEAKANINAQIDSLLKAGYITQDNNEYIISIKQEDGDIKFNNKSFKSE